MLKILSISPMIMGISAGMLLATPAYAINFTFTPIADTNTPIPLAEGNFTNFYAPSLDNGAVAFFGESNTISFEESIFNFQGGIYTTLGGTLRPIVGTNSPISSPDGSVVIEGGGGLGFPVPFPVRDFVISNSFDPFLENGSVIFSSFSNSDGGLGLYRTVGDSLQTIIGRNTLVPNDEDAEFSRFLNFSQDKEVVAFVGWTFAEFRDEPQGVYLSSGGTLQTIADQNTLSPEGLTFSDFRNLSLDNGEVFFRASTRSPEDFRNGIYGTVGGTLRTIVDTSTLIPGSNNNFNSFFDLSADNGQVAFVGFDSNSQRGIYSAMGDMLQTIVDTNTLIPDSEDTFSFFSNLSLNNGVLTFNGFADNGQAGIYTTLGGELAKVITTGDTLLGKEVSFLDFAKSGVDGNSLAFKANFTDGTQGVFLANAVLHEPEKPIPVPEPGAILGLLATGIIGKMVKRRVTTTV